jgi:hypothetical protein
MASTARRIELIAVHALPQREGGGASAGDAPPVGADSVVAGVVALPGATGPFSGAGPASSARARASWACASSIVAGSRESSFAPIVAGAGVAAAGGGSAAHPHDVAAVATNASAHAAPNRSLRMGALGMGAF